MSAILLRFENAERRDCNVFQRLIRRLDQEAHAGISRLGVRQIVRPAVERLALVLDQHKLLIELDLNVIGVFGFYGALD